MKNDKTAAESCSDHASECAEFAALSRRGFLGGAAALAGTAPFLAPSVAFGQPGAGTRPTIVTIFLRGGMDGLTATVPYGDADLYTARPTLAVQPPGQPDGALDLDGFFGFAPSFDLLEPYNDGNLAVVHATGSTDSTRSHFDAMRFMETATPAMGLTDITTGWLGRYLALASPLGSGLFRGAVLGPMLARTLVGGPGTLPIPDPANFSFPGDILTSVARQARVEAMYQHARQPLSGAAADSVGTIELLDTVAFDAYATQGATPYPSTPFGNGLLSLAAMLDHSPSLGLEAAHLDITGWDHHNSMGPISGLLAGMLSDLKEGILAFYQDLKARGALGDVVLVLMSEFGRRIAENGSAGTDHGHGNIMLAMGAGIAGGQVITQWPGLIGGNGDLTITTDYRDVLAEILEVRLGATPQMLDEIFPNHFRTHVGVTL